MMEVDIPSVHENVPITQREELQASGSPSLESQHITPPNLMRSISSLSARLQRQLSTTKIIPYHLLTDIQKQEQALFNKIILKNIFLHLQLVDQNSFRLVCRDWYSIAHECWKPIRYDCIKELRTKQLPQILKEITERPLLKNIECTFVSPKYQNMAVDTIIKHVEDLHSVALSAPTSHQISQIVQKFSNLQSISLDCKSESLVSSIYTLNSCQKLKNLKFTSCHYFKQKLDRRRCPNICSAIADGFPELETLTMVSLDRYVSLGLDELLRKKSPTLLHLNVSFCEKVDSNFINAVNHCSKLKSLQLELHSPSSYVGLSNLGALKSLKLTYLGQYSKETVVETFDQLPVPRELNTLALHLKGDNYDMGIINKFITSFPNLTILDLSGVDTNTLEEQLVRVHYLIGLRHLKVGPCDTMSNRSVNYISRCLKLVTLTLVDCPLKDLALEDLGKCYNLESVILPGCKFADETMLLKTILKLKKLKYAVFRGSQIPLEKQDMILEQCRLHGRKLDAIFD